jgi:glycerol-3-phosphate dehydrogenase
MRSEFASLQNHADVSVLIVGGGINGIGLFSELALQGIDVLLVDKSDFCAGTSAAMTRVIHGGLRYLENAEFRLVRESLRERNRAIGGRSSSRPVWRCTTFSPAVSPRCRGTGSASGGRRSPYGPRSTPR